MENKKKNFDVMREGSVRNHREHALMFGRVIVFFKMLLNNGKEQ